MSRTPASHPDVLRANANNWLGALRSAADRGQHRAVLDCAQSVAISRGFTRSRRDEAAGSHAVFVSRPAVVAAVISQAAQGA
ncbi:hypothetical protein [Trebonia sp.]|uniref:hypothetical protein n=1 Tax=Trebonia sp. TaxID=2767075 RepID=UPI00261B166C|nr:hypothetical protein [Trebonia sp.]